jgi:hypothetical protein
MKLTKQKLYQLIKEELDSEDLKKLADIRPNYLLDLPVQKYSDEPVRDEYGDVVTKKDEWGRDTYELEFEKLPMKDEILRSRIADMKAGGLDPEHIRKIATLMQDDPFDKQAEFLARSLAPNDDFRFSTMDAGPKVSAAINSKVKLHNAYHEIRESDELRRYLGELANRMMHDGSAGYVDNFNDAEDAMYEYEKRIAQKYGLTEEEIDKLDDMLDTDKKAW